MTVRHVITLTCREVVELVTEMLDDAMPAEDRARLEQHLLVCPPCTAHVQQVRDTIALARELPASAPPAAIADVFRKWK